MYVYIFIVIWMNVDREKSMLDKTIFWNGVSNINYIERME